jgi:hypothetical protein
MRSMTLVSDGIVQSRIDNNGGKQKSGSGKASGKLHSDWEVDVRRNEWSIKRTTCGREM